MILSEKDTIAILTDLTYRMAAQLNVLEDAITGEGMDVDRILEDVSIPEELDTLKDELRVHAAELFMDMMQELEDLSEEA